MLPLSMSLGGTQVPKGQTREGGARVSWSSAVVLGCGFGISTVRMACHPELVVGGKASCPSLSKK